jgi:CRP/FNR family cyclic AMP-dependent transcriptional regulator
MPIDNKHRNALLAAHPIFSKLSPAERDEIVRMMGEQALPAKQVVFLAGDPPDRLYVIVSGEVHINILSDEGDPTLLNILRTGDIFGEIALLDDKPRSASATCATACRFLTLERAVFRRLIERNSALAAAVIKVLAERLRNMGELVENLMRLAEPRLASVLLQLATRYGRRTSHGIEIGAKITEDDVAHLARVSRQTVSTLIAEFRRRGLVSKAGRVIVVCDPDGLERVVRGSN